MVTRRCCLCPFCWPIAGWHRVGSHRSGTRPQSSEQSPRPTGYLARWRGTSVGCRTQPGTNGPRSQSTFRITVIVLLACRPSAVAVTVAVPSCCPVTHPVVRSTVATSPLSETQVTVPFRSLVVPSL
jgi:hypothetical protein